MLIPAIPTIDKVIYTTTLDVRLHDISYGRHLGHDSLISLLQEARVQFLFSHGFTEDNIAGYAILIKNLLVDYINEARYGDQLCFRLGINTFTKTSVQMLYDVTNPEKKVNIASALTTLVFFDVNNNKVAKIPDAFFEIIEK